MSSLRIGFLLHRPYSRRNTSMLVQAMHVLVDQGVTVDVIATKRRLIDLKSVRPEHDLYVLKQISAIPLSLAGALHAQGAVIVNPYPASMALRNKVMTARLLEAAGVPTPASYVVSHPEFLAPLLSAGPIIVKPYDGSGGYHVHVVRSEAELAALPPDQGPLLAQRYHPPEGRDLKFYVIGEHVFGVKKVFPARTEAEKHGEPFTPTVEQREIALRCGRALGVDLCGVDMILSEGRLYVVDMQSIPGFKGVPDAPVRLAKYFLAAARRAVQGPSGQPTPAGVSQ